MAPNKSNDSTTLTPQPMLGGLTALLLTDREVKTLRRALKRLRHELEREHARNVRRGWEPAPGRENVVVNMLETIENLLKRLPHPGFEKRDDQ